MSDEKFEEFLQREARAYNTPPTETPRDEMWQVIRAARANRPVAGAAARPLASRRPRLRYAPWIGMAATLLLGVGIGRVAFRSDAGSSVATLPVADSGRLQASENGRLPATDPAPTPALIDPAAGTNPDAAPRRSLPAVRRPNGGSQLAANRSETVATETDPAFQVASREHLLRAEALVSVVAATPRDAAMDSLTGKWAREMLLNTRLLLDSPAGDDPVRRRLLEDLETVLVQLVQRSGGAVNERELIDRTLDRTQLLTRLRASAAGI